MLKDKTLEEMAALMANLARAAYLDDNQKQFEVLGFTQYKFMDKDGAQGHLAASDTEVIITCRGTEPKHANDLFADLNTIPKRNGPGWVHEGFRKEARKLIDDVMAWAAAHPEKDFYITGHSLGAAMATYLAQELEFANFARLKLYTFGSPRLGNVTYISSIKIPHWRFVNCNDVVTHVPPSAMQFKHHGELCYINFYGKIRSLSQWQRFKDMMRSHWHDLKKFRLFDGIQDHLMDGYVRKLEGIRDTGEKISESKGAK